ncbi:phenylalanine--tRNA ligase subunit beta [Paenibacillaceae bacterium]|nr:phenylalanine--tRNA ligase subunit beta [Paenibacillaceae bacterium]
MKVSYQWLTQYIDLDGYSAEELSEKLTSGGIEIDGIESRNKGVTGVVVGYVKSKAKHPDADKLNVCTVDAGGEEDLQIVCGASNVDAGQHVPVAVVGAKLPGGLNIKRAKLRGVESQGMICSAKELGINDKLLPKEQQEGILVLPSTSVIGTPIVEALGLNDEVLEFDLTPNRSDCLSMLGAAYEIAALTGQDVKLPDTAVYKTQEQASDAISVNIRTSECIHYAARYITGVRIAPSPLWMQNRLIAAGIRPISNIVDITNYVLLEYGQPLHAFDADKISGGNIIVRLAEPGEKLVTLDGQERTLEPHMLVIADKDKAVALAGVMGGLDTEVTEGTTNILLESAKFDGGTVRRTSRQLGLRSEASLRFEKEVDPERVIPALDRAASLIAEYAEGLVTSGIVEDRTHQPAAVTAVHVTLEKINRYVGTDLSDLEVKTIFERLHFAYEVRQENEYEVYVPSRRGDITRDVDLIEEVARLYGYDNIPTTAIVGDTTPGSLTNPQKIRRELRSLLTNTGLHEVVSYSFTAPARTALFTSLAEGARPVRLAMPMSEERSVLRTSLLPQLLEIASYNRNRSIDNAAIFEIGSVYHTDEETLTRLPQEKHRLAGLWTGSRSAVQWNAKAEPVTFYDLKGVLESVLSLLGLSGKVRFAAASPEHWHPGRTAELWIQTARGEEKIGVIGQAHPDVQREFDLADTYLFEIELAPLYELADTAIVYKTLPRFPAISRDIAVVVDSDVETGKLTAQIIETAGELLENVDVFDIYTGERLGQNKKSVALSLIYRHAERTLTDEEVSQLHTRIVEQLEQSFHAELRK